jgi:protein O-GlcNAc transferase
MVIPMPNHEEILDLYRRANAHLNAGQATEALALFDRVIAARPELAQAHVGRGLALAATGANEQAIVAVVHGVKLDPPGALPVLLHLGYQFQQTGRPGPALTSFDLLLAGQPDNLAATQGRAMALIALGRFDEAAAVLAAVRASGQNFDYLLGVHLHTQLQCCDWSEYEKSVAAISSGVQLRARLDTPHTFLAHSHSPALQRLCAEIYVADRGMPDAPPVLRKPQQGHSRIRIAYLSSDFRDHAVAQLMVGVFEAHDKERFETYAFSTGPNDGSHLNLRIQRSFEHFIEAQSWSDAAIAARMAELEIDVAIDLGGHSAGGRTRVLSFRPAPIQMSLLGYPGTLGASYVDYLIADSVVVPPELRQHYAEQLIYLPDSYLPTEDAAFTAPLPTRAAAGLPDAGTVFCCFNGPYKISPALFSAWMRVLKSVADGILWLRDGSDTLRRNLIAEAARRGVDPQRLVFAARTPTRGEHYARFSLADVFLDTTPYNAHTTAAEALALAVPIVTVKGSTFAGRVAASLLQSCGMAELAVDTLAGYESLAIDLGRDSDRRASLKERLRQARSRGTLFDSARYCRHLEAALQEAWSRQQRGEPAATFHVERI